MKTYSYTDLPTVKTQSGDNILFQPSVILNYMKGPFNVVRLNLTDEQKEDMYSMESNYRDVLNVMLEQSLNDLRPDLGWTLPSVLNPIEAYEEYVNLPKDEDMTDEEHEIKLQHLKSLKEWYEKQQNN